MGTELTLVVVIASTLILSVAALCWASDEWLQGFIEMARSLGRPM
jgi:hypothetical protein